MGQQGRERNESVHAALLIVKMQKETSYGSENPYGVFQIVDKLIVIKAHTVKYIANTAANTFRIDKLLIIS